jgi:hypothetical protein
MAGIDLGDYRSGGYFLITPEPEECASRTELPPGCIPLSVARALAQTFPDWWAFAWATNEQERSRIARHLAWPQERLVQIQEWVGNNESVKIGFPNVLLSYASMAEFAGKFIDPAEPVAWIGIGLHMAFVEDYLQARRPTGAEGTPGVYQALNGRHLLHEGGCLLGFDILHFEYTQFDSWLWKSLHPDFLGPNGKGLNSYGLLDDAETAIEAATWAMQVEYDMPNPAPHPNWWLPWIVVDYTPPRPPSQTAK